MEIALDTLIENPKYGSSDVVGFNGQIIRKWIFRELMSLNFDAIVETGTFIGDTTGFMAEASQLPVYSCEINHRFHSLAKMRLADFDNIHLEESDSRAFLEKLAKGILSQKNIFFYLDSHWYEDLPLKDEIKVIANNYSDFVIMIDDFNVQDDEGYGYDNYGDGKILSLNLIDNLLTEFKLTPYFPSAHSMGESGAKRGCVILSKQGPLEEKITLLDSLTRAKGF